jgi:hypothetical protein
MKGRKSEAMTNGMYDKDRLIRGSTKAPSTAKGKERQADPRRRCPVGDCKKKPRYWSRYCKTHADRLRANGHPTVNVRTKCNEEYERVLKVGRWVRTEMIKWDSDPRSAERAFERIEAGLDKLGNDHLLKHDAATLVRRNQHWNNRYKGNVILSKRLETIIPEEVLAAYLGIAAVILAENEVMVNRRQLMFFFNKAGAKAVMRYMRFAGPDESDPDVEQRKTYRWRPNSGAITMVGAALNARIAGEFGRYWWKMVDEAVATLRLER